MTQAPIFAAVALLAFGAANLLVSLLALSAWRLRPLRAWLANRSDALLALRLSASAAGLLASLGLALPAFLLFEPRDPGERAGPLLAFVSLLAALPAAAGLLRAARAARASRRFCARRALNARSMELAGVSGPALVVEDEWTGVAVAGFFEARLLIARRVLDWLSPDELRAVVAHEQEHVARRDNLRRLLVRSAPDWLAFTRASREIERSFSEAAEREADRGAMRHGPRASACLASALLAVARIATAPGDPALASALHSGSSAALRGRVLALTGQAGELERGSRGRVWGALALGLIAALPPAAALHPQALAPVYALAEVVVRSLL